MGRNRRVGRGDGGRGFDAHGGGAAGGPLNLIHRNNSPKLVTVRLPGRFVVSITDPEGLPLQDVLKVMRGELSPVEFLVMRRAADAKSKP